MGSKRNGNILRYSHIQFYIYFQQTVNYRIKVERQHCLENWLASTGLFELVCVASLQIRQWGRYLQYKLITQSKQSKLCRHLTNTTVTQPTFTVTQSFKSSDIAKKRNNSLTMQFKLSSHSLIKLNSVFTSLGKTDTLKPVRERKTNFHFFNKWISAIFRNQNKAGWGANVMETFP